MLKYDNSSQSGSALITTLMMLALLLALSAGIFKKISMSTITNVAFVQRLNAFAAAEAGIQAGRTILDNGASDGWEDELVNQTLATDVDVIPGKTSYTITVADNSDFDGSTTIDGDDCIFLTSVGTAGNRSKTILAMVGNVGRTDSWQDTYSSTSLSNIGQAKGCN